MRRSQKDVMTARHQSELRDMRCEFPANVHLTRYKQDYVTVKDSFVKSSFPLESLNEDERREEIK